MINYEKILPTVLYCTVLYCTVLYCSIDVLGCDCCKKLCGKEKSGEKGVQKEKNELQNTPVEYNFQNTNIKDDSLKGNNNLNNGQTNVFHKKSHWAFLEKYNTSSQTLLKKFNSDINGSNNHSFTLNFDENHNFIEDNNLIFVVFEQHDANKGDSLGDLFDLKFTPFVNTTKVYDLCSTVLILGKLLNVTLFFNGDPNLTYNGFAKTFGERLISDEDFRFDKDSTDPILKRTVFISYFAQLNNYLNYI